MYEQTVERIAYADATRLGIIDNGTSHLEVALFVKISVHHSGTRLDDRNAGSITYEINQPTSAARDTKINIANSIKHLASSLKGGREQSDDIWINAISLQYLMNELHLLAIAAVSVLAALQHTRIAALEAK